ncbi:hypothetical protein DFH27DRAFT_520180 [Peziza echinospora]|nr:hypothetical protein DFH27DRAFT_520180 [Peziza echinospora]
MNSTIEEPPHFPFDPKETRGPLITRLCIGATVVISIIVPLRLIVRAKLVKWIGWDDWMIVLATVFAIASVHYGAGSHYPAIKPEDFPIGLKLNLITQLLNLAAILFVKISICFFIARLAPKPIYRKICYGTAIFMTFYTIFCEFTIALQCIPMEKIWNRVSVQGTCMKIPMLLGFSYTYSAVNILTDFFLVFLPVPMIWNIQIAKRQKFALILILALGSFAAACSLVKLKYTVNYGKTGDFLWDSTQLTVWSVGEINVGIVCACMPALKPLVKRFLEKTGFTTGSRGHKSSGSGAHNASNSHRLSNLPKGVATSGSRRGHSKITSSSNESEETMIQQSRGIPMIREEG